MRIVGGPLLALAALALWGCSIRTIASTPTSETIPPTSTTSEPLTTTSTTVAPTTTAPPTTAAPTTVAPTTTTTTTTIPANVVEIAIASPPVEAVGKSDGEATQRAQQRLLELGFWLREPDGNYDLTTQQAVMAFQKYYGLETDGSLGPQTALALTNVTIKPHGRSDAGTLVEIDKGKQVLFFVNDGAPQWILNTSTGSGQSYKEPDKNTPGEFQTGDSITRNGLHEVYRERAEGWWKGDLGEIYRPKYFTGGIAVHGSNHVPDYPASHGCVRVTTQAMDWIWAEDVMPMDMPVWVHEGAPEEYDSVVALLLAIGGNNA